MIGILLQTWGGVFYLTNKICFSRAERGTGQQDRARWRIRSWVVYLAGLPAWVLVFVLEHNWIAAAVETGGAPGMIMGLFIARKGQGAEPCWLDPLTRISVVAGLVLSIWEFQGITTMNQVLELGIAAGFLMGTYLMARDDPRGYPWLLLGNASCALLMALEAYYLLMCQQLASLAFVLDAMRVRGGKMF